MNMNKTCLIDLDGTMYCGDTLIPGAKIFIDWMLAQGNAFFVPDQQCHQDKSRKRGTHGKAGLSRHLAVLISYQRHGQRRLCGKAQ